MLQQGNNALTGLLVVDACQTKPTLVAQFPVPSPPLPFLHLSTRSLVTAQLTSLMDAARGWLMELCGERDSDQQTHGMS